jgi:hypothetical protein
MKPWTLILLLAVMIALLVAPAACKPQDFAEADNRRLLVQPTATYAALKNNEAAIYITRVAPARAEADAKSIVARADQQIEEDKHQQQLRYAGEMAALTLSNTQRLNILNAQYAAEVEGIKASGVKEVMDATAAAEERAAQARIATAVSLGVMVFVIVVGVGGACALNKALDNRATIIDRTPDGSIKAIIKHGQIVYDSALGMGPITAAAGPLWLERLLLLLAMWRQMNKGGEHTSPWQVYRDYKQITSPTLAHPLPASEEAALLMAQGAQRARVDAIAAKSAARSTAETAKPAVPETADPARQAVPPSAPGSGYPSLTHPAFQPLPKLEVLDAIDAETMRTLELVTGQS